MDFLTLEDGTDALSPNVGKGLPSEATYPRSTHISNFNFLHTFEKYSNIKFHENPSSGSRVVPCERRQTDMTKLTVALGNFGKAPKIIRCLHSVFLLFLRISEQIMMMSTYTTN
jgi:hypothetical protein